MTATWFQGPATKFIDVSREGFNRGVSILHFLGGFTCEIAGTRAIAQTKMTINQRATVDGVERSVAPAADGFTAIEVKPGTHVIQMNYRPGNAKYALLAAGLFALLVSAVAERAR